MKKILSRFGVLLVLVIYLFSGPLHISAFGPGDLDEVLRKSELYSPEAVECGPNTIAQPGGTSQSLSAQLAFGLDQRWIDIIQSSATEKGTDPLFMAALLYVENRGFPEYKTTGWSVDSSRGGGPWQITGGTWPDSAGDYVTGSQDPAIATPVAAELVKNMGGNSPSIPMGSIRDDFSRGQHPRTVAELGKNYNAGSGTWREPGVAGYKESGRVWTKSTGPWGSTKNEIIDNYIVIFQHVYYHIASGMQVPAYPDNNVHAAAALAMIDTIEGFRASGATPTTTGSEDETETNTATSTGRPVIVLDPGHGGPTTIDRIDSETGLKDGDYRNPFETDDVFAVALAAKADLEAAGYTVLLTKNDVDDSVFLRDRAEVANNANAAMAISIHTQGDRNFGTWQEIYVQKVGLYRGSGANKLTFTNAEVAEKSQSYAAIMKQKRDSIEVKSGTTVIKDNSFDNREGKEPGNIPLVQLFSTSPWIYLEAGGNSDGSRGLSAENKATYARSVVEGVKAAVPSTGAPAPAGSLTGDDGCGAGGSTAGGGDAIATALEYAWPTYKGSNTDVSREMKPEYDQAVAAARGQGLYVGGIRYPGVDCGGFVTRVMLDSGYEPSYNQAGRGGYTFYQLEWVRQNWTRVGNAGKISSTSELQPGDVAFQVTSSGQNDRHTFMFVGEQEGFETMIASASLDKRAPMAGRERAVADNIEWYRK